MIKKNKKLYIPLSEFITEYSERNTENKYSPVAVGKYGIRSRESIYSKELASDYSKNKLIYMNTLTVGMGSKQIDVGVLIDDITYSVSPAYHTYKIANINAKYLDYCIQCRNKDMFNRFAKRGSRQGKTVDLKRWITYKIPVYDDASQAEIVDHLNRAQLLIELRKKQLEKLDQLIKARFVEMFGDIKLNPNEYQMCKIEELLKSCEAGWSGNGTQRVKQKNEIAVLKVSAVTKGYFNPYECKVLDDQKNIKKYIFPEKGDLIFSRANTREMVGATAVITQDYPDLILPDKLWKIKFKEDINVFYIKHVLSSKFIREKFSAASTGTSGSMFNVSMKKFKSIEIPVAPFFLQNQFATFVKQVDKSKFIDTNIIPKGGFYYGNKFFIS